MATSIAQISANRANAQKSTGAITSEGKAIVSQNAISHGLFAKNLILKDENPLEYQLLFEQLQQELSPVGILEQSLVERVAISLWKQKRLLKAETARLNLELQTQKLVDAINSELNWSYSSRAIRESDLTEVDEAQIAHCEAILREFDRIDESEAFDAAKIAAQLPTIFQELCKGAKFNDVTPEDYLQKYETPAHYFRHVARYVQEKLAQQERQQLVLAIAQLVKDKRTVLPEQSRDSLAKYQVMLDNELYKALKALRETQAWRVDSLQSI